jgi:hypothetical protein
MGTSELGARGLSAASERVVKMSERRTTISARCIFMKVPFLILDDHPGTITGW